jgi:hypothetical protein
MYQTATPVGRRRSKAAERQAEIMRQHFSPPDDAVILTGPAADQFIEKVREMNKPKRGRKAKAK